MIDEEDDEGGGPAGEGATMEGRGLLTVKSNDDLGSNRSRAMQAKLMRVNFTFNPHVTMGGVQFRC